MMIRRTVVVLVLLAAVAPSAAGASPHSHLEDHTTQDPSAIHSGSTPADVLRASTATTTDGNIHQYKTLALTPDRPGEIQVTVAYGIPDNVRSLNVTVPKAAEVGRVKGFSKTGERTYTWDGVTASPSIVFDFQVNRTYGGARQPAADSFDTPSDVRQSTARSAQATGYSFVDTGPWAITQVPSLSVVWSYVGTYTVRLDKSLTIEGDGATGGEIAYLGPMKSYTHRANGQRFQLVVPAAASMAESPKSVLTAIGQASGMLMVGERDKEVFFVAAPTSVNWGPRGLEYGGSDSWVRADAKLSKVTNVWFHEYVHTRQAFDTTTATKWTTEGTADYFAALLTLRQGRIAFEDFRQHLQRGTQSPYASAVLAEPSTWSGGANYLKGSLVFGTIDRRIRLAGDQTADDVFAQMNADTDRVRQAEFLAAVEAAGTSQTREFARKYTETSAVPEMWTREQHLEAFPAKQLIAYEMESATYRVTGPFRNGTVSQDTALVTGETLHVEIPVRNTGNEQATYQVSMKHAGSTVAKRTDTLEPGARTTVSLSVPLKNPGTYTLSAGPNAIPFEVQQPAPIRVSKLSVAPPSPSVGEQVTATVRVENPADRPAAGTVELISDGSTVLERRVRLGPTGTKTVTATLRYDSPGDHTLQAGNATATVSVQPKTTTQPGTTVPVPLRWSTVVAALALAVVLLRRK